MSSVGPPRPPENQDATGESVAAGSRDVLAGRVQRSRRNRQHRQIRLNHRSSAGAGSGVTWLALGIYLALAVFLWWNVWSTHPTTVTSCACGDASLFLWFLEWPAYAIAHGHNPFFSTALFHPTGINLLSNTSVLGIGVLLAPVTWIFGPVTTMNVASTLAPALSALAMFWFLRRRVVEWVPAAFAGGLVFGFSPFLFVNVAGGHLMTSFLALVPLMVACLDELLIRQRADPVRVGLLLGVLATIQFFVSTEVLMIFAIASIIGTVVLVVAARAGTPATFRARIPYAARGLGAAGALAIVLLAYPLWFALEGPSHLAGLVWPTIRPGTGGISLANIWSASYQTGLRKVMQTIGGYEGPALPQAEYLGTGMLAVVGAGLVVWWRSCKLWFFVGLGAIGVWLSLGTSSRYWVPWNFLRHVPVVESIVPGRFMVVATFCAAAGTAIVVERARSSTSGLLRRRMPLRGSNVAAGAVALVVAAVAIFPVGWALSSNIPFTTESAIPPQWFRDAGSHLRAGQVALVYPAPISLFQQAESWQAVDSLQFAMVGGSGPEALPQRAGDEVAGFELVSAMSFSLGGAPSPSPANVRTLREALANWGVTIVVFPVPSSLPRYSRGTSSGSALGLLTLAIGKRPGFVDDAWVWNDVRSSGPMLSISGEEFTSCVIALAAPGTVLDRTSGQRVTSCIKSQAHGA